MVNKRLDVLAQCLQGYDKILDIGCDHGLVIKKAIDQGFIQSAIAADIGEKPLNQAKKNLVGYPVEFVVSNGFESIHASYDMVVIAGMGVYTIIDILSQKHQSATYILQANDKYDILRQFLFDHGYHMIDEYVVFDKFFYIIFKVAKGSYQYIEEDLYVGPILKTKPEAKPYYRYQINRIKKLMKHADVKTINRYQHILSVYEKYV